MLVPPSTTRQWPETYTAAARERNAAAAAGALRT
jgi:hypothetical protein